MLFSAFARLAGNSDRVSLPHALESAYYDELIKVKAHYVIDGDTFDALGAPGELRIRLAAVDCPEDDQPWGDQAKIALTKLVGGRNLYLECYGRDCYGRLLATVYVKRGYELINVNERMVMLGHAWVMWMNYDHLSKNRRRQLDRLQTWARSKRVGLWRLADPVAPWEWRAR